MRKIFFWLLFWIVSFFLFGYFFVPVKMIPLYIITRFAFCDANKRFLLTLIRRSRTACQISFAYGCTMYNEMYVSLSLIAVSTVLFWDVISTSIRSKTSFSSNLARKISLAVYPLLLCTYHRKMVTVGNHNMTDSVLVIEHYYTKRHTRLCVI